MTYFVKKINESLSLEEFKLVQLDILDNVYEFLCKTWDYNIDIYMPKHGYNKFMNIFNLEESNLKFESHKLKIDFGDVRT